MGRPLDEKYMGDFSNLGSQFDVTCFVEGDTRRKTGSIIRQKSNRRFEISSNGYTGFCDIVTREPNEGEMSIVMNLTNLIEGSGATFRVLMGIDLFTLTSGGSGYQVNDELNLDMTGGLYTEHGKFEVLSVDGTGVILSLRVKSGQRGKITALPSTLTNNNLEGGNGTGATLSPTFLVSGLEVVTPGSDYTELSVIFAQGDAKCNPKIINGKISNIVMTNNGTGYTIIPGLIVKPTAGSEYVERIKSGEAILANGDRIHF
tara:strand:- start:539 stop:1318 length:780 start_codon:yes stop_codon:yes gene_type:complete